MKESNQIMFDFILKKMYKFVYIWITTYVILYNILIDLYNK